MPRLTVLKYPAYLFLICILSSGPTNNCKTNFENGEESQNGLNRNGKKSVSNSYDTGIDLVIDQAAVIRPSLNLHENGGFDRESSIPDTPLISKGNT